MTADTLFIPDILDAAGQPADVPDVSSPELTPGTLVEVDDAYQDKYYSRVGIPVPGHAGRYFVADVFTSDLKDVRAEYAAARITQYEREDNLSTLVKGATGWVERSVVLSWTRNPPGGLEVGTLVRVVAADKGSITFRPVAGDDVVVLMDEFRLDDIEFERTSAEIAEREEKLQSNKERTPLTYEQALGYLANVPLLTPWTSKAGEVPVTVLETSAAFEARCVDYLVRNQAFHLTRAYAEQQAVLVNGYTDHTGGSPEIFLRPGTQGDGIEVHESVHTLCAARFEAEANFFLSEGVTEYFTRLATAGTFSRRAYDLERFFVKQLVNLGASTPQILAELYFGGNWAGFHQGLYARAELVSVRTLLDRAAQGQYIGVLLYLKQLMDHPEEPLRHYQ